LNTQDILECIVFLENRRWDQKHLVALHGDAFDNRLYGLHGLHDISDVWCTVW
jgi:hypothetical protein